MTHIELRDVTKISDSGRTLLDDIRLDIPSGQTLGVIGPPDAGKSLLLRVIAGLEDIDVGEIVFDGLNVRRMKPRERDVALVLQDHVLMPRLDVYENLAFAAALRRGDHRTALSERVTAVAEALGLSDLLSASADDLDEAEKQRTAIGRALVRRAALYLFDDVFAAQDHRLRAQVRSVVKQWQTDYGPSTNVFVTSDVLEAFTLADSIAVMDHGKIRQVGSPRSLYERPTDLLVAVFSSAPAMNLLPATVDGTRLTTPFTVIELADSQAARLAGRALIIVGIRPEDCYDASSAEAARFDDPLNFPMRVDDVEWRGARQYAYTSYELARDVEQTLEALERSLGFEVFQNFFEAELPGREQLQIGQHLQVAIPRERLHFFDAEMGRNLMPETL